MNISISKATNYSLQKESVELSLVPCFLNAFDHRSLLLQKAY